MKSTLKPLAALVAVACGVPEVYAQSLEEVVVSARKRNETLEDAPISVKAFTEAEIASAGITTPQDFIDLTPNVTLVQTQNAGNSFLNIRGVSQARNSELSAAVLIDGVLMSNPTQFNQQLFDIEQIEVLRGPQGALYGRNAIGGAITINTKQPGDELEGRLEAGVDSGPGYKVRGTVSGPLTDDIRFRLSGSYMDTDGFINNRVLGEEADPVEDLSARMRLIWDVTETFSADFRLSYSMLDTQALYFRIAPEADDLLPVRVNNPGNNEREFVSSSLKLEWVSDAGTLTAITAYDDVNETLSGDQFNFLPRAESDFNGTDFGGFIKFLTGDEITDLSQNQYLEVESISQEVRFASPEENRLRWIAGAYAIATDRYISTGNQIDRGFGVFDVKKDFRPSVFVDPTDPSPQLNILADGQDNFAWAVFGQVAYDVSDRVEASFSLRYDKDDRENTTLTPELYNTSGLNLQFGDQRDESWDAWQPKFTLRYQPSDDVTLYADVSRGFRSGGFNQTGVGEAANQPGVSDLFDEQISDTFELGAKGNFWDGRASASLALFYTQFDGAYFFFFDPGTSTQNLGNITETDYMGLEFEASAAFTDNFSAYVGFGYTDSEIQSADDPSWVGNQAPLVSEYNLNLGTVYRQPVNLFGGAEFVARADFSRTGETWWEPANTTSRSPINLLDLRIGFEAMDNWTVTLWGKNVFDEEYNTEFSPGGFIWPALPARYGFEFSKRF
ncbi:MAG: TonB-dependent receptor [Halieaceae bacterium]|jgi:iron complex outermembrane receptor protein|nr:TonB-dependent receptor [Halieaceae bacterium]